MAAAEQRPANTRSRILDVGERLVQVHGFNGFSYADVAAELSVTKASLHYHFPSKAELGEALIARYAERFAQALAAIDVNVTLAPAKLDAYASLYTEVLRQERMCLCGMLAAEYQTLPSPIRNAVVAFLDDNEAWLALVLEQGREEGSLHLATHSPTRREVSSAALRVPCSSHDRTVRSSGSKPPRLNCSQVSPAPRSPRAERPLLVLLLPGGRLTGVGAIVGPW